MKYNIRWKILDNSDKGCQTLASGKLTKDADKDPTVLEAEWLSTVQLVWPEHTAFSTREYFFECTPCK